MEKMKKMLAMFRERESSSYYNVPQEEWVNMKELISFSVLVNMRKD